jgi:hypothetical protein
VSAGWVAGSVRARSLATRRLEPDAGKRIAACSSLSDALAKLDETPYRIPPGHPARGGGDLRQTLEAAQRAIAESVLWKLRVLAGWLPQGGTAVMRTLAAWFEVANITERLHELDGGAAGQYFDLGVLATAWPRLRELKSRAELRRALAASLWRDPGGETAAAIEIGLRATLGTRVAALGEPARTWAAAAIALLLANEEFAAGRPGNPVLRSAASALLGSPAVHAATIAEFAAALPRQLSWVIEPETAASELWRKEAAWWHRAEQDGIRMLGGTRTGVQPVIGASIALAADARRISAALEVAARGGRSLGAFDALA